MKYNVDIYLAKHIVDNSAFFTFFVTFSRNSPDSYTVHGPSIELSAACFHKGISTS